MIWQPLDTAPEDVPVLIHENGVIAAARMMRIGGSTYWNPEGVDGYNIEFSNTPTHWMPLPPPPEQP